MFIIIGNSHKQESYRTFITEQLLAGLPLLIWIRSKLAQHAIVIINLLATVLLIHHMNRPSSFGNILLARSGLLEHYIDCFVSVGRTPPTWFGKSLEKVSAAAMGWMSESLRRCNRQTNSQAQVNGDMLEGHGSRPYPDTTRLRAVKCKRTDRREPLLCSTVSVSGARPVIQKELYGGLYTTPLKLDYRSFFSLDSVYCQTLPTDLDVLAGPIRWSISKIIFSLGQHLV